MSPEFNDLSYSKKAELYKKRARKNLGSAGLQTLGAAGGVIGGIAGAGSALFYGPAVMGAVGAGGAIVGDKVATGAVNMAGGAGAKIGGWVHQKNVQAEVLKVASNYASANTSSSNHGNNADPINIDVNNSSGNYGVSTDPININVNNAGGAGQREEAERIKIYNLDNVINKAGSYFNTNNPQHGSFREEVEIARIKADSEIREKIKESHVDVGSERESRIEVQTKAITDVIVNKLKGDKVIDEKDAHMYKATDNILNDRVKSIIEKYVDSDFDKN